MSTTDAIEAYFEAQSDTRRSDLRQLHAFMMRTFPDCDLWFSDGTDASGKVVTNPSVGYGRYTNTYADGSEKEVFCVGLSANTRGISVYVMGLGDRNTLRRQFADRLGTAKVTSYCITFRSLADVDLDTVQAAMQYGMDAH